MSDEHDPQETVSVGPTLIAFTVSTVVTFGVMFLSMIWNHNGGGL